MPASLKYLVNTVNGTLTALNGSQEETDEQAEALVEVEEEEGFESFAPYVPTRFKEKDLPAMVDMREFMTEVENQAGVNSCAANAIVGAFEYIMARSGDKVDFSRLFVYYNARHLGNFLHVRWAAAQAAAEDKEFDPDDDDLYAITDDGCRTINAFRALMVYGVCREETWDYEVRSGG
jgi:hypothetical protein